MNGSRPADDVGTPGVNMQPQATIPGGTESKPPTVDQGSLQETILEKQDATPASPPGETVPKDQPKPIIKGTRKSYVPKEMILYVIAGFFGFFVMNAILGYAIPYLFQLFFHWNDYIVEITTWFIWGDESRTLEIISAWFIFVLLLNVGLIVFFSKKNVYFHQ